MILSDEINVNKVIEDIHDDRWKKKDTSKMDVDVEIWNDKLPEITKYLSFKSPFDKYS